MTKNKYNQAVWGKRIKKRSSLLFQEIGSSIDVDKRLFREDIMGSLVHIEMLNKQKIITPKIITMDTIIFLEVFPNNLSIV